MLRAKVADDGLVPVWTRWWDEAGVAPLFPDPEAGARDPWHGCANRAGSALRPLNLVVVGRLPLAPAVQVPPVPGYRVELVPGGGCWSVFQGGGEFAGGHGAGEVETLKQIRASSFEVVGLRLGFDAFADDGDVQVGRDGQHRFDDGAGS